MIPVVHQRGVSDFLTCSSNSFLGIVSLIHFLQYLSSRFDRHKSDIPVINCITAEMIKYIASPLKNNLDQIIFC